MLCDFVNKEERFANAPRSAHERKRGPKLSLRNAQHKPQFLYL